MCVCWKGSLRLKTATQIKAYVFYGSAYRHICLIYFSLLSFLALKIFDVYFIFFATFETLFITGNSTIFAQTHLCYYNKFRTCHFNFPNIPIAPWNFQTVIPYLVTHHIDGDWSRSESSMSNW